MSDMMGGCKNGGGNCGKLDCAWGCCWPRDTSASVPTGSVPRVKPLQRVLHAAAGANNPPVDVIAQAVDDYLLMERKARAWDQLRQRAEREQVVLVLADMDRLVHSAPAPSKG